MALIGPVVSKKTFEEFALYEYVKQVTTGYSELMPGLISIKYSFYPVAVI